MKRLRMLLALGLLASALITGPGCDSGPTAPTIATSPSPSPTPDPKTDVNSCVQTDLRVIGYNGAGNPDLVFGVGEMFAVIAHPINEAKAIIPDSCRTSTSASWLIAGPCMAFGDLFSTSAAFWCIEPGTLSLVVTHGRFRSAWAGRIVR